MLNESVDASTLHGWIAERFAARNVAADDFFPQQALPLARACRSMFERFERGGRLIAFGRGAYATDAQHVSVEFVHPVIVGKRALPALDVSLAFEALTGTLVEPNDIVMGFGPPGGDAEVLRVLDAAQRQGALTFALPGPRGDYRIEAPSLDAHVHQELVEILCHTLYESVHVFFEHREIGKSAGDAAFLYPFLGEEMGTHETLVEDVARSILAKAQDARALRTAIAASQGHAIGAAIEAIHAEVTLGGKLIVFGNGGSATDATDWVLDCVMPEDGSRPIRAVSLALEPAIITAIANDVGSDLIFLRQLVAQTRPHDVAIALSTSGGSKNVIAALEEARRRRLLTIALLGYDGGEIVRRGLADITIVVHSDYIPRIQEVQGSVYHIIREGLERAHHA